MINSIFKDSDSNFDQCLLIDNINILEYPWHDRWLNGEEYSELIKNYKQYCKKYNFEVYNNVPKFIYLSPKNGTIFFLKGNDLKEVRFPKLEDFQKKFKWKKMNFITHLPKKDPKVSYLVASTYSMEASPCFRMHLVVLYHDNTPIKLCHILQIYPRQNENDYLNNYELDFNKNIGSKLREINLSNNNAQPSKCLINSEKSLYEDENKENYGGACKKMARAENIKLEYDVSKKNMKDYSRVIPEITKIEFDENFKNSKEVLENLPENNNAEYDDSKGINNDIQICYYDPIYNPMRAFHAEKL